MSGNKTENEEKSENSETSGVVGELPLGRAEKDRTPTSKISLTPVKN